MINIQKVTESLVDAIVKSGRSIKDIPSSTLVEFLSNNGIPRHLHTTIISNLESLFIARTKKEYSDKSAKSIETPKKVAVTSNNVDLKKKEPKKDLFGEIKKIT